MKQDVSNYYIGSISSKFAANFDEISFFMLQLICVPYVGWDSKGRKD